MLSALLAIAMPPPVFAPPIPWALNFADPTSFVGVGDIDGDGFADLIRVYAKGDAFIDVAVNSGVGKCVQPIRANSNWGKDCQAVCFGDLNEDKRTDVVGVFDGDQLRVAERFDKGRFFDMPNWAKLPRKLAKPHLAIVDGYLYAWAEKNGQGFRIDLKNQRIATAQLPANVAQVQEVFAGAGHAPLLTFTNSTLHLASDMSSKPGPSLGTCDPGEFPAVAHGWIFIDHPAPLAPEFIRQRRAGPYPKAHAIWAEGDMDHDGDMDLVQFRFGSEAHTGTNVLLHRRIMPNESDCDHDGLTNVEEALLGTDPYNPDTDGDGLLDGWEVKGFRGLDLKKMGCDPRKIDLLCLVSRFPATDKAKVEDSMNKITGYYAGLGWGLHPIWLDSLTDDDTKKPWWENRDNHIPLKWKGVVHFMQISPFGGGQADQLGDGGGCGGDTWALYATFIHEFGHQLGLSHEGFYASAWCPTYPSMMNYAYSYTYEDDIRKIRYSDGRLANYILDERDLDETIPLPISKVEFLTHAPYHYRLKAAGDKTLIDWNWNGIFGEKHVRADINYAYSTTAGRRDDVGKTMSAPWLFTHGKDAYVLYAQHGVKLDGKSDPSVSKDKPGWLMLRRLITPFQWGPDIKIVDGGVTGDPVALSYKGTVFVAYPSVHGPRLRIVKLAGDKMISYQDRSLALATEEHTIDDGVPSLALIEDKLFVFVTQPNGEVTCAWKEPSSAYRLFPVPSADGPLHSTVPVSVAYDPLRREVILGLAQDQDKGRPSRWQIRRYRFQNGTLEAVARPDVTQPKSGADYVDWVEGEKGGARGNSRPTVLYDKDGLTGMKGRILFFGLGMTSLQSPWSCGYVAQTIGDKTVNGGWQVKRYYDEWTQSRSASAACWFKGDILYAYRWVDGGQGASDNTLHVGYNGTGIEPTPMGDFDDIGFMRSFGIRHSILYLRE